MSWDWNRMPNAWSKLIEAAWAAPTLQKQHQLAQKALQLSAECIDAYVILAEHATHLQEAYDLYIKGTKIGERQLATELSRDIGHFWGIVETRPYMRAHFGLALAAWQLGQHDEAIQRLWRHLELNPNDSQGARDVLLGYLQAQQDEAGLDRLCQMFPGMEEIRDVAQPPILLDRSLQWVINRSSVLNALYAVGVRGLKDLVDMPLEKLQASAHAFLNRQPHWFASLPAAIKAPVILLDVRVDPDTLPQHPFGFGIRYPDGEDIYLFEAPQQPAGERLQVGDHTVILYPRHQQIWEHLLHEQQQMGAAVLCYGKQVQMHLKATAAKAVKAKLNVIDLHQQLLDTVALPIESTSLQDVSQYLGWGAWGEQSKPYMAHLNYLWWLKRGDLSDLRLAIEVIQHNIDAIAHIRQWAIDNDPRAEDTEI
jgi:tetratricopeptide (TPR) repeat protein